MVSFIAFLASFPIVLNMNYQLNLLTLIFNIVIIYIMTVVILPFAYITFIIPLFDKLYGTTNSLFIALLDILSNIELFVLKGYISTIFVIMILYIFIFFVFMNLEQRKSIYRLVIFIIFVTFLSFNLRLLDPRKQIVFLDVHGDSTLIKDSFDQCNILIDTGDVDQYDTVNKYILSKNISRIDYLIVSHFHSDHYGETQDMYQNALQNVIDNTRTTTDYEEFKKIIDKQSGYVKMMWCGDQACEEKVKADTTATSRCMPFDQTPIGKTCPVKVTSPVIATSLLTGIPVIEDTIEVTIPIPADGPSFGVAPSGT